MEFTHPSIELTYENILQLLTDMYRDPLKKQKAKRDFNALETFQEFRSKFSRFAFHGDISCANWKDELFDKVYKRLRDVTIQPAADIDVDLKDSAKL
jgi:hypothetical protein